MKMKITQLFVALFVFGITNVGNAQVLQYIGCVVDDVPSLTAAMSRFYDSMAGEARPTVSLDLEIWNGENPETHTIIIEYPDYQTLETFRNRVRSSGAAILGLGNSFESVASCDTEGLGLVRQLLTFVFSEQRDGSCSSSRRESDAARGVPSPAAHR